MQQVRGFVYFEEIGYDEMKSSFDDFRLGSLRFAFFKSLNRHGNEISNPGIFFSGETDDALSSADIVNAFRERAGLRGDMVKYDVSVESEDRMEHLKKGGLKGNYTSIRIRPPYDPGRLSGLAGKIGMSAKALDIYLRTAERENGMPVACIDIITKSDYNESRRGVESIVSSGELKLGYYTFITLE